MTILTSKQKIVVIFFALAAVTTVVVKYISSNNETISTIEPQTQSNKHSETHEDISGSVAETRNTNTQKMLAQQAAVVSAGVQNAAKEVGKKTEEKIAEYLKERLMSEPDNTLQIAKEALKEHPNSEKVPEFHWYVIRSLMEIGRRDEAIKEAKRFVLRYPGNYHAEDVRRHLLTPMAPPQ